MYRVGLWFLGTTLLLIAIDLSTKFQLYDNSSFKGFFPDKEPGGRTDKNISQIVTH